MIKYPMLLTPAYKDYIWGGDKLKTEWGKESDLPRIAESWELSMYMGSLSFIENGEYAGDSLYELLEMSHDMTGAKCRAFNTFPMLVKLIDSRENLSVQVHPSDKYALEHEKSYGKSEVWYVLDAEEGSGVYFGFKRSIAREEYKRHIENNTLTDILNFVEVKPGDVFMIEAGTVHAIGAGLLICEIQQNSNLTYRVYDYGRVDSEGKGRELHIDKALKVSKLTAAGPKSDCYPFVEYGGYKKRLVANNKYFLAEHYVIDSGCHLYNEESFISLTVIGGNFSVTGGGVTVSATKGRTVFIPAGLAVEIVGKGEILSASL
jgi:mannose-6-phosphate isomerase